MLLRLVQARIVPEQITAFRAFYEEEVLPALSRTRGCLFACLAVSSRQPGHGISFTFWNRPEDAADYERSGVFASLLNASRRFFAEPSPWEVRLSEDLQLEITPGTDDPVINTYLSTADESRSGPEHWCHFLRIVSLKIQPGNENDFITLYRERVLPELRRTAGCCSIHLAQSAGEPREFISLTIWRTRSDAERYEREGTFRRLLNGVSSVLTPQARAAAERESPSGMLTLTSEDIAVDAFNVVTAKAFGQRTN